MPNDAQAERHVLMPAGYPSSTGTVEAMHVDTGQCKVCSCRVENPLGGECVRHWSVQCETTRMTSKIHRGIQHSYVLVWGWPHIHATLTQSLPRTQWGRHTYWQQPYYFRINVSAVHPVLSSSQGQSNFVWL
ncbi:uncharacterized protein LOC144124278 [Amblyomma americanum]